MEDIQQARDHQARLTVLRHDHYVSLAENIPYAHDRIERPEACIVAVDVVGRHSSGYQSILHVLRLIVFTPVIIAADDQIFDFMREEQLCRRGHSIVEEQIPSAVR